MNRMNNEPSPAERDAANEALVAENSATEAVQLTWIDWTKPRWRVEMTKRQFNKLFYRVYGGPFTLQNRYESGIVTGLAAYQGLDLSFVKKKTTQYRNFPEPVKEALHHLCQEAACYFTHYPQEKRDETI